MLVESVQRETEACQSAPESAIGCFQVTLLALFHVALFVEIEAVGIPGFWNDNSILMITNERRNLLFYEMEMVHPNANNHKSDLDRFRRNLKVVWLQKMLARDQNGTELRQTTRSIA